MATAATKPPKQRRGFFEGLRAKRADLLVPHEIDALLAEGQRRLKLFEEFEQGEVWKLAKATLEHRRESLKNQLDGLVRRLSRPIAGQPPVTTEQIAGLNERIEENKALISFPALAMRGWRAQIEELEQLRRARA